MKDKELSDKKYNISLMESNVSQRGYSSLNNENETTVGLFKSQSKEKITLVKIKEQYH